MTATSLFAVSANGTLFGNYSAASAQAARDACAQDAGYQSEADMAKQLGQASELVAVEVQPAAKKAAHRTIHTCDSLLGGVAYRATSDGKTVSIQTREVGRSSWKTEAKLTVAQWDKAAAEYDLSSAYGGRSPAHLCSIIRAYSEQ